MIFHGSPRNLQWTYLLSISILYRNKPTISKYKVQVEQSSLVPNQWPKGQYEKEMLISLIASARQPR